MPLTRTSRISILPDYNLVMITGMRPYPLLFVEQLCWGEAGAKLLLLRRPAVQLSLPVLLEVFKLAI